MTDGFGELLAVGGEKGGGGGTAWSYQIPQRSICLAGVEVENCKTTGLPAFCFLFFACLDIGPNGCRGTVSGRGTCIVW